MKKTKIFTDGSTLNNQNSKKGTAFGGYGGYIIYSNGDEKIYSEPLEGDKITNQVSELMAYKHGLNLIIENSYLKRGNLLIEIGTTDPKSKEVEFIKDLPNIIKNRIYTDII